MDRQHDGLAASTTYDGLGSVKLSCTVTHLGRLFFFFLCQTTTELPLKKGSDSVCLLALVKLYRVRACLRKGASSAAFPPQQPGLGEGFGFVETVHCWVGGVLLQCAGWSSLTRVTFRL